MTSFAITSEQFESLMAAHERKDEAGFILTARQMLGSQQLSDAERFRLNGSVPRMTNDEANSNLAFHSEFAHIVKPQLSRIKLPPSLKSDLDGISVAIQSPLLVRKFLFTGAPGTGKTASVANLARKLKRQLLVVDSPQIINSRLGESAKNIADLFQSLNHLPDKSDVIVLFDEIDMLVMSRYDQQDIREMGRVTSTFLRELDHLDPELVIIATTNLVSRMDPALRRRFDAEIDFNQYDNVELAKLGDTIAQHYLRQVGVETNHKLVTELCKMWLPMPAIMDHVIKTVIAFNGPDYPLSKIQADLDTQLTKWEAGDLNDKRRIY